MLYLSTFLEGLLSFFSPCILPLLPIYLSVLSGSKEKSRLKTFIMTLGFCLGISTLFFFFAFVSSHLTSLFKSNQSIFQIIAGIILIIISLFNFGLFSINTNFTKVNNKISNITSGNLTFFKSFILGFLITITWSPCIGPMLGTAITQSSVSGSKLQAFLGVSFYTLGFISIFILLGLFTNELLSFINKRKNIVKYTKIISAIVILCMGIYLLYQGIVDTQNKAIGKKIAEENCCGMVQVEGERELNANDFNFTLRDMDGNAVVLSDYVGKPIILSFSATWCPYCKTEWEHFSKLAETGEYNVFIITTPNIGNELDEDGIKKFIQDRNYKFNVLYDNDLSVNITYQVYGFPSTYFFNEKGELVSLAPGYVDEAQLNEILEYVKGT